MDKKQQAVDAAIARATSRTTGEDRAARNRAAWPVAMHLEHGELKEDRPIGRD